MPSLRESAGAAVEHEHCVEAGCDRSPAAGDLRCVLHASRLGPMPCDVIDEDGVVSDSELAEPPIQEAPTPAVRPQPELSGPAWSSEVAASIAWIVAFWGAGYAFVHSLTARTSMLVDWGLGILAVVSLLAGPVWSVSAVRKATTYARQVCSWIVAIVAFIPAALVVLGALIFVLTLIES